MKFTITIEDVEQLQNAIPKVMKTGYKWEQYETYEYILTDWNEPLQLLATAHDLLTYNEVEENSFDYIDEQKKSIINNLDYASAFLSIASNEDKLMYADDISLYNSALNEFIENQKEQLLEWDWFDNKLLNDEYHKDVEDIYKSLWKEYINGDYHNDGIKSLIIKRIEWDRDCNCTIAIAYNGDVTIDITDYDEDDYNITKETFCADLVRCTTNVLYARRQKAEKYREEYARKKAAQEKHKQREEENTRKKILSSIN